MARISEIKTVRIVECSYTNPFYLRWVNRFGGVDYWLFQRQQVLKTKTDEKGIYEKYIEDYETATESTISIGKDKIETYVVGAENLDLNDYNGIKGIVSSPLVEYYNGSTWFRVLILPGTWEMSTRAGRHQIEFEVQMYKNAQQW